MQTYHTLTSRLSKGVTAASVACRLSESSQESRRRESLAVGKPKGISSPASLKGFRRKDGVRSSWQFPVPVTVPSRVPASPVSFPLSLFFLGQSTLLFLHQPGSGIKILSWLGLLWQSWDPAAIRWPPKKKAQRLRSGQQSYQEPL